MECEKNGGEGSNLKSSRIEIKIWGRSRAIDTYFWIQTLGEWGRGVEGWWVVNNIFGQ